MTPELVVLCLAAFAISASLVSVLCRAALPSLDRLASRLAPRHRVRLWLAVLAAPAAVGLFAVVISFLPAVGVGRDHCLSHAPHHPHLCPHHMGGVPGIALVALAVVVVVRVLKAIAMFLRGLLVCRATARTGVIRLTGGSVTIEKASFLNRETTQTHRIRTKR